MPDIDFQKIELNLIPKKGDDPVVFYASQYETSRPFIAVLKWGDTEYAPGVDCYAEIDIRKNDDNLVVITDDVSIDNNKVSVILPVQAVTCIGKNLGQVKIYAADDQLIAALNFILEVQPDPLAGGVTSETAIDNLESQIEDIAEEVIGEDYYDKTEVDALLADKADKSELPDMTDYYTKTETDNLLDDKANLTDLATLASKAEVTQAISDEDTALKNWVSSNFATPSYVATNYYTKLQVDALLDNIFPTLSASGAIASFTTALNKPLVSVTHEAGATTITRCGKNLLDYSASSNTVNGITYTVNADKTITANGTATAESTFVIFGGTGKFNKEISYISNGSVGGFGNNVRLRFGVSGVGSYDDFGSGVTIPVIPGLSTKYQYMQITVANGVTLDNVVFKPMIRTATTASDTYEEYNSQTVPVADATTLNTLTGVNNVFADSGDVTVQYKYMSI